MLVGSRIIASVGVLDLDHLGAEIRQSLRTGWSRDYARKIHDQQTVKSGRRVLGARQAVRQWRSGSHGKAFPCRFGAIYLAGLVPRTDFRVYSSGTTRASSAQLLRISIRIELDELNRRRIRD